MNALSSHHHFGPYALLASARQAAVRHQPERVCGWCLKSGRGKLVKLGNILALDSHATCIAEVQQNNIDECRCLDPMHPGDTPTCPVHGSDYAN